MPSAISDLARRILERIAELEAAHAEAIAELHAARLDMAELEASDELEGRGAARERLENAESHFRSDPSLPHQENVVAAILDVLREAAA